MLVFALSALKPKKPQPLENDCSQTVIDLVRNPETEPVAPVAPVLPSMPFVPGAPCKPCSPVTPVSPLSPFSPRGPEPPSVVDRSVFLHVDAALIIPVFLSIQTESTSPCGTATAEGVGEGVSSAVAVPNPKEPIKIPENNAIAILVLSFFVMYPQ